MTNDSWGDRRPSRLIPTHAYQLDSHGTSFQWFGFGILLGFLIWTSAGFAQPVARPPGSREIPLRVRKGEVPIAGKGRKVLVRSRKGEEQVVLLHCQIGEQALIMRPTGELDVVPASEIQATDKPLNRATKQAMIESLESAGLKGFKTAAGKPYLFVYDCSDAFYMHTRSILESMFTGVVTQLKDWRLSVRAPIHPLVVVIFPSRETFDAFYRVEPEVVAYYRMSSNRVILYEDLELSEAAPEFALKQAAYTIAHEGIHQLLANTHVQQRRADWPMWISEGLPEFFCPLSVSNKVVKLGSAELPVRTLKWQRAGMVNDLRMVSLSRMGSKAPGEIMRQVATADDLDADGYALSWGLIHYLTRHREEDFENYLAEVSQLEPFNFITRKDNEFRDLFVKHFGDDFETLESSVQEHLQSRRIQKEYDDPIKNQTRYVIKRVLKKGRAYSIGFSITTSPAGARQWKEAQEALYPRAKFFTIVCKTAREAEYEVQKFKSLGR